MSGDNHRVDATPNPPPEAEPEGVGPWNMPLTVCPTPDMARPLPADPSSADEARALSARPALEDGTPAGVGPERTGQIGRAHV